MNNVTMSENNQFKKKTRGPANKTPINKEIFNRILKSSGYSVRKLGAIEEIPCTEKTIRRSLNEGKITPEILDAIAQYINVKPELLSGDLHKKAETFEDEILRHIYLRSLTKEKHPYYTKRKYELWSYSENGFVENILSMYDVSLLQFKELEFEKQYKFQHELICAITPIMLNYFDTDSYGRPADPNFGWPQVGLENWWDDHLERQWADTELRDRLLKNLPAGYTVEDIKRMSPDELIDLNMDLYDGDNRN